VTVSAPAAKVLGNRLLGRLTTVFAKYPDLESVVLFGSRATGAASPRSDIDLATSGILSRHTLGRLKLDLDDLNIPQRCDVVALERILHEPLLRHIEAVGVTIYRHPEQGATETDHP